MSKLLDRSFNPDPLPSNCTDYSEEIKNGVEVTLRDEDLGPKNNRIRTGIRELLPMGATSVEVLEVSVFGARLPTLPCGTNPRIPLNLHVPLIFLVPVKKTPEAAPG